MTALFAAFFALVVAALTWFGPLRAEWNIVGMVGTAVAVWLVTMIVVYLCVLTPMAMWKQLRDKVRKYEATSLAIFYDGDNENCDRRVPMDMGLPMTERLFRIGVTGSAGKLINGVVVRIEEAEPTLPDVRLPLHPMSSKPLATGPGWDGDGSFSIRPGDTEYVDVLRYPVAADPSHLYIVRQGPPKRIPLCSYELELTAQAETGQRTSKVFEFEFSDDGLRSDVNSGHQTFHAAGSPA